MSFLKQQKNEANWVECEKRHGFDLNKNPRGCPLCELARKDQQEARSTILTTNLLARPSKIVATEKGNISINLTTRTIGNHPWFNTFFSGKAAGRILGNLTDPRTERNLSVQDLLAACKTTFVTAGLMQYRGFPKNVEESSSMGRLAFHFIQAFSDLGFFVFKIGNNVIPSLPSRGWDKVQVSLTISGAEFVMLPNKLFDEQQPVQQLTNEERTWLINYLKKAVEKGFGEYKLLKDFVTFLAKQPADTERIRDWFLAYPAFKQFIENKSKRSNNSERAKNVAATLAGSKLALLRELGMISNTRNDYSVLGKLE